MAKGKDMRMLVAISIQGMGFWDMAKGKDMRMLVAISIQGMSGSLLDIQ